MATGVSVKRWEPQNLFVVAFDRREDVSASWDYEHTLHGVVVQCDDGAPYCSTYTLSAAEQAFFPMYGDKILMPATSIYNYGGGGGAGWLGVHTYIRYRDEVDCDGDGQDDHLSSNDDVAGSRSIVETEWQGSFLTGNNYFTGRVVNPHLGDCDQSGAMYALNNGDKLHVCFTEDEDDSGAPADTQQVTCDSRVAVGGSWGTNSRTINNMNPTTGSYVNHDHPWFTWEVGMPFGAGAGNVVAAVHEEQNNGDHRQRVVFLDRVGEPNFDVSMGNINPGPQSGSSAFRRWPTIKRYGTRYFSVFNLVEPSGDTRIDLAQCDAATDCTQPTNWMVETVHTGAHLQHPQLQLDSVDDNDKMMVVWQESTEVSPNTFMDRVWSVERCGLMGPWSSPELVYDPGSSTTWTRLEFGAPNFILHKGKSTALNGSVYGPKNLALVAMIAGSGPESDPDTGDVVIAKKNYTGCP